MEKIDELVASKRRIRRGQQLFHAGAPFESIYPVRFGFFKTCVSIDDGREQVTGFHMAGELVGLDGIVGGRHVCNAIALEDSEVCVIPFARLETLSREIPGLQRQLHRLLSQEIVRDQGVMLLLGSMRADERLAAFILHLTHRLRARGFSSTSLVLRMTRQEIGSYLGMTLETVSRCLSRFASNAVVEVRQRELRILDEVALRDLIGDSNHSFGASAR